MLYGETNEDLYKFVTSSQSNKQFLDRNSSFWLGLIKEVFIDNYKVRRINTRIPFVDGRGQRATGLCLTRLVSLFA